MNPLLETIRTYDAIAPVWAAGRKPEFWRAEFSAFLALNPGPRVIDLGCGSGREAPLFREAGFDYVGVDRSVGLLSEARARNPGATFLEIDMSTLNFPEQSFDAFWSAASLLHVPKLQAPDVLREWFRILKPGGIGFIAVKQKREVDESWETNEYVPSLRRYFVYYEALEAALLLVASGFTLLQQTLKPTSKADWLCYYVRKS